MRSQLNVSAIAFRHYARRAQTRSEHATKLAGVLGLPYRDAAICP
jgi:hypothetical protein